MKLNYKKQKLVESLGFNVNFKTTYGDKPQNVKITPSQFKRLMESYLIYEEKMHKEEEDLELAALKDKRAEIMRDMEQEAEIEGGPIADKYGDMLNKIDKATAKLGGHGEWGPERDTDITAQEIAKRAAMLGLEEDIELAEFANSFSNDSNNILDEMNFGDGDLKPYFEYQDDFDTENFNNSEDLDEGGMGYDNYMRDKYDGRDSEVIGVYSDIDNQRYGGKRMPGEGFYTDGNGFISEIKNMSKAQKDFVLRETKKELNKRSRR